VKTSANVVPPQWTERGRPEHQLRRTLDARLLAQASASAGHGQTFHGVGGRTRRRNTCPRLRAAVSGRSARERCVHHRHREECKPELEVTPQCSSAPETEIIVDRHAGASPTSDVTMIAPCTGAGNVAVAVHTTPNARIVATDTWSEGRARSSPPGRRTAGVESA